MKTPSELSGQFPIMKEMLDRFGIKREEIEGYEADDIIGTLTKIADGQGIETIVVTGDKDMLQLVSTNVNVLLTRKGISEVDRFDVDQINEKYGLLPQQIIDLKGLMGDTSDNIPGVPGVGEKTALKLLHEYETVENVLEHIKDISGKKLQENLSANKQQAMMSKDLATIYRNMELSFTIEDLVYRPVETIELLPLFEQLEFKSLIERLGGEEQRETKTEALSYTIVSDDNMSSFVDSLTSPMYGFLEVDGTNSHNGTLIGLALANETNVFYIPEEVLVKCEPLLQWLADKNSNKVFHDSKRTRVAFCWKNISLAGVIFDTELASYVVNPTESNHELSHVSSREAMYALPSDEEVYGKGAKRSLLEGEQLAEHICRKA
ncbi:MAG: 5'-3' exonuclease H3TH domain-containing protein, partial [Bacilli bacterium]